MHVNNSEQWTEYGRPGSEWFISIHEDGKHAVINSRHPMQGLAIPVEAARAIIKANKFEGHPETPPPQIDLTEVCWLCKARKPEKEYKFTEGKEGVCAGCFDVLVWYLESRKQRRQEDLYLEMVRRGLVAQKR